jgi:predicted RNA-binding protein with PUA-like domain
MGTWGTPTIPESYREYIEEQKRVWAERRERDRRNAIREDMRRDQGDDSMSTVMGLYALNSYATHMAGAVGIAADDNSDNYQQTPTNTDSSSTGGMD